MTDHAATEPAPDDAPPEVVQAEIVESPTVAGLAVVPDKSALERAADEMMATPGAPGRDEFLVLATTARILSLSAGAPKAIRDNPWLAFHVALIGRDLGISPSAAIQQIDVIGSGDDSTLSLSPELLNGQIRRLGLGAIVPANRAADHCTAVALLPGGRIDPRCGRSWPDHVDGCRCTLDLILGDYEFTWQDAMQAGLVHKDCSGPTDHTSICLTGGQNSGGKRCHQGYRTYPKRMMWWRAAGYCADDYFPEAGLGLYTAEELGSVVDPETGRPYDPGSVELPEGYEPPEKPRLPGDDPLFPADGEPEPEPALLSARDEIAARIEAISAAGPEAVAKLKELWEVRDEDGNRRWPSFRMMQRRHLNPIRGMIATVERMVKRGEWGDDAKAAWTEASTTPADAAPVAAQAAPEPAGDGSPPEDAAAPENEPEPPIQADPEQVAAARTAVEKMTAVEVADMIRMYEAEPSEDPAAAAEQLVDLLVADAANAAQS